MSRNTLTAIGVAALVAVAGSTAFAADQKPFSDCTVTMIPKALNNPYFASTKVGMQQAQAELGGNLQFVGPTTGVTTEQISLIQAAGQQGACVIGVAALDATAIVPALDAAAKRGTKIITWDSDITPPTARSVYADMASVDGLGRSQFQILADAMHNTGEWAIISSQSTATSKNLWLDVMKKMAEEPQYSGMKLVKTTFGDDDSKKSYDLAVSLIRGYPDLKGIMAPTPIALEAAVKAAEDLGVANQIVVTGLGNPGSDAELLKTGKVPAYVLWSPVDLGYLSYYAAKAVYEGKITGKDGETFDAGRLGKMTLGCDGCAPGEIIMGLPITFTAKNVESYIAKDFKTTYP
jgi:rhamnose transport system substrate-binding protein